MNQNRPRRAGKTLIEMLVVITLTGAVTAICVTVMASIMRADGASRTSLVKTTAHSDLANHFRQDAHRAKSFETNDRGEDELSQLEFQAVDGSLVRYHLQSGSIVREALRDHKILNHQQFPIDCKTARFESSSENSHHVSLIYAVTVSANGVSVSPREIAIVATTGKDLRFLTDGEESR